MALCRAAWPEKGVSIWQRWPNPAPIPTCPTPKHSFPDTLLKPLCLALYSIQYLQPLSPAQYLLCTVWIMLWSNHRDVCKKCFQSFMRNAKGLLCSKWDHFFMESSFNSLELQQLRWVLIYCMQIIVANLPKNIWCDLKTGSWHDGISCHAELIIRSRCANRAVFSIITKYGFS